MTTPPDGPPDLTRGVVLLIRRDCHLCAEAERLLSELLAGGPASPGASAGWTRVDVDRDPELRSEWGDMVPALLVDGRCVDYGALDRRRVVAAVTI